MAEGNSIKMMIISMIRLMGSPQISAILIPPLAVVAIPYNAPDTFHRTVHNEAMDCRKVVRPHYNVGNIQKCPKNAPTPRPS